MGTIFETVDSEWFNQRLTGFLLIVLVAFCVMLGRLLYLQLLEGADFRRISENNSIRIQDIDAPRGVIQDRNGRLLVDNRPSFDLFITRRDAKPLEETLQKLGRILHESPELLAERMERSKNKGAYAPILLKADIDRDMLAAIEVHRYALPGVQVRVTPRRHYLNEQVASHVLGYLGEINAKELDAATYQGCKAGDLIGKFGIEKAFDNTLRGKRGGRQVQVNAVGQVERILSTVPAEAGRNLLLTIDMALQARAEELLDGQAGAAVAIDPNNGEILAMASSPSFDPNWFVVGMTHNKWNELTTNPFRPLENKAIQAEYPPASTYKIITAVAGLQEGVINSRTSYFCPGGYQYGKRFYRCWKRSGHGSVNVTKALSESCDTFFYQVGEHLGVDRLAKYAHAFGLGVGTKVDLDHEAFGLIPTSAWKRKRFGEPWHGGETLSVSIGQGFNLATPLQMAVVAATIGNGGVRYRPQLVRRTITLDDRVQFQLEPEVVERLQLNAAALSLVQKGLWMVVNDARGTAWKTRIKEVDFSGKTGTAQVVGRTEENERSSGGRSKAPKDHAWFVAYAPSVAPKIALAVIVEHGEHGSSAAAPIAAELIKSYLGIADEAGTQVDGLRTSARRGPTDAEVSPAAENADQEALIEADQQTE